MCKYFARSGRGVVLLCAVTLLVTGGAELRASTVVPMDLPTMSDYAGQVIVGRVAGLRSYWTTEPRRIETEVTLTDVEYLKGQRSEDGATFRLRVPGGTVGKLRMHVTCAPEFAVGQRWVLFLLPTYRTHPVVGFEQGAFQVIEQVDGTTQVCTAHGTPIVDIDAQQMPQTANDRNRRAQLRLVGSEGVRLRSLRSVESSQEPLTLDEFRQRLAPILAKSRGHDLAAPAGQPDIARLEPVPMQVRVERGAEGRGRLEAARGAVQRTSPPPQREEAKK